MQVACSACGARYTIADEKIPVQGARIRCRKCQAVFSIERGAAAATPPMPSDLPLIPPTPQAAPSPFASPAEPPSTSESSFASPPAPPESPFTPSPSSSSADYSPFERPSGNPTPQAPPENVVPTEIERFATAFASTPPPVQGAPAAPRSAEQPQPSAAAPPQSAPTPSASPAPSAAGTSPSTSGIPAGLPEAERLKHERARRLARVLASDIAIYNKEKKERGAQEGNLVAVLGYEIKKSWEVYKERVTPEMANSTPYFRDALNEMLAEGKKVF